MGEKEFTVEELRMWYNPRTWFRRSLEERPQEEFDSDPQLGTRLGALAEEAHVLLNQNIMGKLSQRDYKRQLQRVRRDIGNILYV